MTDRRRTGNYKHIGGYVSPDVIERFRLATRTRDITQSEALEEALLMWIERDTGKPKDIHDYVARNLDKLRDSGVKSLAAIAKREALPTQPDFCKIAAELKLSDQEKKRLWELAYGLPKGDASDDTRPAKRSEKQ